MTTSPSSGLSPEAKEFVPIGQTPTPSIPLYVDENTVASIYPSDQQPLMVQAIYPMMITNSKLSENIPFPEIEFHIQPSQQQQFHIDSCANLSQSNSSNNTNNNSSNSNTSQIVLLPTTNSASAVTPTGYYGGAQILYPTTESLTAFYPMEYCEQPLINFSLQQQPPHLNKSSNRISSQQQQQQRPNSFRQQHGTYRPSSRGNTRGNGNHRNPYYEYNNSRRNGSSYNRGNSSTTSKRISSSYHQHEYNNYYHSPRSRGGGGGYPSHSSQTHPHDDYRKNHSDYYNNEHDYQQSSQMNDDETPFEFRPEDFPSLPINNQPSDKTPPQSTLSTTTKATSSWNEIVSAPRPHSTSPHSLPPTQDSRSDRSRSFNTKISSNNERKSSNRKGHLQASSKSPIRASKSSNLIDHESSHNDPSTNSDDGFIQTKQQHRRLKRKHKIKEESEPFPDSTFDDSSHAFPNLTDDISLSTTTTKRSSATDESHEQFHLTEILDALPTKSSKANKTTRINKKFEENQNSSSKLTVEKSTENNDSQNETDTDRLQSMEKETPNSHPLSSNSDNSSDTSDYDDAVDNFDDQ